MPRCHTSPIRCPCKRRVYIAWTLGSYVIVDLQAWFTWPVVAKVEFEVMRQAGAPRNMSRSNAGDRVQRAYGTFILPSQVIVGAGRAVCTHQLIHLGAIPALFAFQTFFEWGSPSAWLATLRLWLDDLPAFAKDIARRIWYEPFFIHPCTDHDRFSGTKSERSHREWYKTSPVSKLDGNASRFICYIEPIHDPHKFFGELWVVHITGRIKW